VFGSFASFGTGIATVIRLIQNRAVSETSAPSVLIVGSLTQSSAAVCDILITGSLIYYFRIKRSSFKKTNQILDRLIMYSVTRGILTTICQIMTLILLQKIPYRNAPFFDPFSQVVGRFYTNSVMASLNVRTSLRDGENGTSTGSNILMTTSTFSIRDPIGVPQPVAMRLTSNHETMIDTERGMKYDRDTKGLLVLAKPLANP